MCIIPLVYRHLLVWLFMDWIQVIVLAILQGLTEFLPISSSAHLILVPMLLGWQDQGLLFDVSVHVGTLVAVIVYFRRELMAMSHAWFSSISRGDHSEDSHLAWAVICATIPASLLGVLAQEWIEMHLRSAMVIGLTTLLFGFLLGWADWGKVRSRTEYELKWRDIFIIGFAQALALIPGTSRSGITMTAGLMLGFSRTAASRFSFLLSIPLILAAGGLQVMSLVADPDQIQLNVLLIATALSALTAYTCIAFFLRLIERLGMMPFVVYRLLLGGLILAIYH